MRMPGRGLQLKEKQWREVVRCAEPGRASQTIREALAEGATGNSHRRRKSGFVRYVGYAKLLGRPPGGSRLGADGFLQSTISVGQTGRNGGIMVAARDYIMAAENGQAIRVKRDSKTGWLQMSTCRASSLTIQSASTSCATRP